MLGRQKMVEGGNQPSWLITFSDLMTLLLTFFVLLLSMSVIDERVKRVVLGSVTSRFGVGEGVFNPLGTDGKRSLAEPGAMDIPEEDMAPMRDMIFDEAQKDLDFQENKYIQILSINDQVLFMPGSTELRKEGIDLLDKLLPYLQRIEHPMLVAGHTATQREEEGGSYTVRFDDPHADSTWLLSFRRAMAVYRHLISRGIPPEKLMLEAFGQFHPRYSNDTPEGRHKNQRVDIVLDKRNSEWIRKIEELQGTGQLPREAPVHRYKGFTFELTMPGTQTPGGGR